MGDLPEANLALWWRQFDDPLLISLIERGLSSNYDLRIARERICEARAVFGVEFAPLLPKVDAFMAFNRIRNSQTLSDSPFIGGTFVNYYQAGFDTIWEIDLFGKIWDRAKAACYDVVASYEEVRNVHVTVAGEIASRYFQIRSIQEKIEITKEHINRETEFLELVKERYRAGLISQLDIYQSKGLLNDRVSDLPALEIELYKNIYSLGVLTGNPPEKLLDCFCKKEDFPCVQAKFPLGLPTELLCRRGDIQKAEYEMLAAGARVISARKEFLPTISLEALYSYATGFYKSWFKSDSRQWSFTPSITLPIFRGGEIVSHIRYETSLQRQSVLNYEQTILKALEEVENALLGYFYEGSRLEALTEEVAAYENAVDISLTLYTGGLVDYLNVIQNERDLYQSQLSRAETKGSMMTQLVAVYKSLGGGWECCD